MAAKGYSNTSQSHALRLLAVVLPYLSKIHIVLYRWTGGIVGGRIAGNEILLLTTVGHKTGQPRTTPVAYLTDGEAMFIIGGSRRGSEASWLMAESASATPGAGSAGTANASGERRRGDSGGTAASLGALSRSAGPL